MAVAEGYRARLYETLTGPTAAFLKFTTACIGNMVAAMYISMMGAEADLDCITNKIKMYSTKKLARLAGALYLIVVLTGIFNLAYVPSQLIVWDNPSATVKNIMEHETLFRLGIYSGLLCYTAFLLLPLALYKLFQPIHHTYALLMVAFAVTSVPISFINMGNKLSVLTLLTNANYKAIDTNQLHAQIMLYLHAYSNGNQIASLFWGLWLAPLGYLIFKSGLLPRVLGIFLMLGCFGYLMNLTGNLLFPNYDKSTISNYITLPASIGEIGTCLWLLIMGAKNDTQRVSLYK